MCLAFLSVTSPLPLLQFSYWTIPEILQPKGVTAKGLCAVSEQKPAWSCLGHKNRTIKTHLPAVMQPFNPLSKENSIFFKILTTTTICEPLEPHSTGGVSKPPLTKWCCFRFTSPRRNYLLVTDDNKTIQWKKYKRLPVALSNIAFTVTLMLFKWFSSTRDCWG